MACLLLNLEGPLQSWGYRSRFSDRDTGLEPTKSGVIGLLCCALGRDRAESVADLAELRMHIRVEQEGKLLRDFQTAGGGSFRSSNSYFAPKSDGSRGKNPVLQDKWYLQDAKFLVVLEGNQALLLQLKSALDDPKWPLSLGRRSCPPATNIAIGVFDEPAEEIIRRNASSGTRYIWETRPGSTDGEMRSDVPVKWNSRTDRQYQVRFVQSTVEVLKELE